MSFFDGVLTAEDVIVVNKQFCEQSKEPFGLDYPEILDKVIEEFNSYNRLEDDKEKAIQKASCLMEGLVFQQPFKNGNKRTAVAISLVMIGVHNHEIEGYKKEETQEIFYNLLDKTMMKMEGDQTIRPELEQYLRINLTRA